jgi:hypothetical protein
LNPEIGRAEQVRTKQWSQFWEDQVDLLSKQGTIVCEQGELAHWPEFTNNLQRIGDRCHTSLPIGDVLLNG